MPLRSASHDQAGCATAGVSTTCTIIVAAPSWTGCGLTSRRGVDADDDIERDLHRHLLRVMLLQRRFEERCAEAYALGNRRILPPLIGQEATGTGHLGSARRRLRHHDYRDQRRRWHAALRRGRSWLSSSAKPPVVRTARAARCTCSVKSATSSAVTESSRQLPIATGVGFAIKYRGGNQVCLCFFGEAAVNGGAFHEALNMAGLWRLPVVFVVENNHYGMGTAFERAAAVATIADRGRNYNVAHTSVDGQDVMAVRAAVAEAVARARPTAGRLSSSRTRSDTWATPCRTPRAARTGPKLSSRRAWPTTRSPFCARACSSWVS